jgi:predicted metal-dependent HD superfamily phosphohydrolase
MMNYSQILEDVKDEVTHLFENNKANTLPYHNLDHTTVVVSKAAEIGRNYELDDKDFFIVVTAAWFHDTGYLNGPVQDHELRGVAGAENFLQSKEIDLAIIHQIKDCIMATRMPQNPHNLLEQIVCDADLYHLGTAAFKEINKQMKKEVELRSNRKISKDEWRKGTITLLEGHHYQTKYAQKLLEKTKQDNLNGVKLKVIESEIPAGLIKEETAAAATLPNTTIENIEVSNKEKVKKPVRGIETMFKISSANHQRLSDMADNKSNIMISTTSIILSILLSVLLRKLEDNHHLIIPAMLLLIVCVTTMVFAILATRPGLPNGLFTKEDVAAKRTNLLFFGNFYRMGLEDFNDGMETMMNESDFLYGSLIRDLYAQGIVLGKKYRLLRIAYNIFMYGIVFSVLAFIIAVIISMN